MSGRAKITTKGGVTTATTTTSIAADGSTTTETLVETTGTITFEAPTLPPVVLPPASRPGPTNTGHKYASTGGEVSLYNTALGVLGDGTARPTYKDGSTISGVYFPAGVYLEGNNLTFIGCAFGCTAKDINMQCRGRNITFLFCTFAPDPVGTKTPPYSNTQGYQYGVLMNAGAIGLRMVSCSLSGFANGIQCDLSNSSNPLIVQSSYFHDARADGGKDHTDCILVNAGGAQATDILIEGNTLETLANTNLIALQGTGYTRARVVKNSMSGGGYALCVGTAGVNTDCEISDNEFTDLLRTVWGPHYPMSTAGTKWARNRLRLVPGGVRSMGTSIPLLRDDQNGHYLWPSDNQFHATDWAG